MAPLRILISNDDGVFADGIRTLADLRIFDGEKVSRTIEEAGCQL